MKNFVFCFLSAVLLFLCAACSTNKEKFAGTWTASSNGIAYYMELESDGTGTMNVGGISFILTYEIDDALIIYMVDGDFYKSIYVFSNKGKTLLLKNMFEAGSDVSFTRIK
jgi:hypothetical protein